MSTVFVLKVTLAPLLVIGATLATRRWGSAVGGWVAGFPLTSGPISVLLSLQYGVPFGRQAAHGTLLGLIGVCAFVFVYDLLARRATWPLALSVALLAFATAAAVLQLISPGFLMSLALLVAALCVCLATIPFDDCTRIERPAAWWDLPLRIGVVLAVIVGITSVAPLLGERLSGLLSPLPIVTGVLVIFAHRTRRIRAARRLLRGVVAALFGFAGFFVVVYLAPLGLGLFPLYVLALVACFAVNAVTYDRLVRAAGTAAGHQ